MATLTGCNVLFVAAFATVPVADSIARNGKAARSSPAWYPRSFRRTACASDGAGWANGLGKKRTDANVCHILGAVALIAAAAPGFLMPPRSRLRDPRPLRRWREAGKLGRASHDGSSTLCGGTSIGMSRAAAWPQGAQTQRQGWGDDVVFHEAVVQGNVEAARGLRLISIDVPNEVSSPFSKPGQFVQAKPAADAKPSFYAISSPPESGGTLEFLIKDAESNSWLTSMKDGDAVQLSPAMGRGFNIECEAWQDTVSQVGIFATGSGIAPMRSMVESGLLKGKVSRLYVGAQDESALAFQDRYNDWKEQGVEVVPVLSRAGSEWSGRTGYVQEAFTEDEERGEGFVLAPKHGALLCGQKEMVQAVREVYAGLGVPEERTLLNF